MSDSEVDIPSESVISQKLRDVVLAIHKAGNPDDLTLKRVRVRAEKELGLPDNFLKSNSQWKQKSEVTINDAVSKYCNDEPAAEPTPKKASKAKPKTVEKKAKATSESNKGVKRKATAPAKKPKKRRKTDSDSDDIADDMSESEPLVDELSEAESEPPKKPKTKLVRRDKKVVTEDSDEEATPKKPTKRARKPVVEDESEDEPAATPVKKPAAIPPSGSKDDLSESEMSSLIDESPKKKSKQKKEPKAKKETKPAAPKAKATKADDSPDAAEVKRLQGWLVKCGIRKVWSRDPELSKCDTDKEKIRVLKSMLKDVGMDGKYSVEKAAKIKEQREFAKDLAAIQEAEVHWGTTGDNSGGRPKRRAAAAAAAKPQPKLVLSDDEEEEGEGNKEDEESSDDDDDDVEEDDDNESGDDKDDSEVDDSE